MNTQNQKNKTKEAIAEESVTPKYNVYKITTEHGVSKKVIGESASQIRKDFEVAMSGVRIERIELVG